MRRFAPHAASSSNQPPRQLSPNRQNPPVNRHQKVRPPRSQLQPRRMPSDTPAALLPRPPATSLRHARCLLHPLREAAARCPHCGGTFCRECVTDEEGQLACPPCLRRLVRPRAPKPSPARLFRQVLAGLTAFVCLTALIFAVLSWRTDTPEEHLNLGRVVEGQLPGQSHE